MEVRLFYYINDYQQAQNVLTKLLSIASFSDACIVCVLHQNKSVEDKTLRGALGTELQNKSFETYECQKDPETLFFTVRQTATRKYDISSRLTFCVDNDGLPHRESERDDFVTNIAISSQETKRSPLNPRYLTPDGMIDKSQLFGYILKDGKRMSLPQLRQVVMNVMKISSYNFASSILTQAMSENIIRSITLDQGGVFYELSDGQEAIF